MTDGVKPRVARILSSVFGVPLESVDPATSQATLDTWDSLSHVHLVTALEAEFSVTFSPDQTLRMTSVQAIYDVLHAKGA